MVGWWNNNRGLVSAVSPHPCLHIPQFHIWSRLPPHLKELNNHSHTPKQSWIHQGLWQDTEKQFTVFFIFSTQQSLLNLIDPCFNRLGLCIVKSPKLLFSCCLRVYFAQLNLADPSTSVWLALSPSTNWLCPGFSKLNVRLLKTLDAS